MPSEKIPRKGTLLEFVWNEKMRHPEKVLLIRVGEFYGHSLGSCKGRANKRAFMTVWPEI